MKWRRPGAAGVRSALAAPASAAEDAFPLPLELKIRFQASSCPGLDSRGVRKVEASTQVVFYVTTGLQMDDKHVVGEHGPSDW